jgi:hypothetical protein
MFDARAIPVESTQMSERPAPAITTDRSSLMPAPSPPLYTPRRVRFVLAHWEELEALAASASAAAHLRVYLDHEWALLQSDRSRRDCLCPLGEPTPPAQAGRRSAWGDGAHGAQHTLADLRQAADSLPITWTATRAIYAQQARLGEWRFRHGIYRRGARGRPQDALIEPATGAWQVATRMMALALGWRRLTIDANIPHPEGARQPHPQRQPASSAG